MTSPKSYETWKRSLGIVRHKHALVWTDDGVLAWLPEWSKEAIVHVWNWISCRLMGHEDYGFGECSNCCKPLPKDPKVTAWLEDERERYRSKAKK